MSTNTSRSEVDIEIGGETRQLKFRVEEIILLEDRLGSDVLHYVMTGKSQLKFCVEAVFCGLVNSPAAKRLTPQKVMTWFNAFKGSITDMQKEILYAIARGKPGKDGEELAKALDSVFNKKDEDEEPSTVPPTPAG